MPWLMRVDLDRLGEGGGEGRRGTRAAVGVPRFCHCVPRRDHRKLKRNRTQSPLVPDGRVRGLSFQGEAVVVQPTLFLLRVLWRHCCGGRGRNVSHTEDERCRSHSTNKKVDSCLVRTTGWVNDDIDSVPAVGSVEDATGICLDPLRLSERQRDRQWMGRFWDALSSTLSRRPADRGHQTCLSSNRGRLVSRSPLQFHQTIQLSAASEEQRAAEGRHHKWPGHVHRGTRRQCWRR